MLEFFVFKLFTNKINNTAVLCFREDDLAKKSESAQMVKDFFDKVSVCLYVCMMYMYECMHVVIVYCLHRTFDFNLAVL